MSNTTTNISVSKFSIDPLTGEQTSVNVSVSSDDTELLRLLSLAGFSNPVIPTPQVIEFQPDEVEIVDSEEIVPEQADYDYGNNPTSRKGYELELDPYEYTGTAREPVRYTPARMADNPLESKSFIQYLDKVINESTKQKLLPPPGTNDDTSHYLKSDTGATVEFKWKDKRWVMKGGIDRNTPASMSKYGWSYYSPK